MRKSYLLMAAAATMFAACTQSDALNEAQVQDEAQAIGFSTYAGKVTRAENNKTPYSQDLEKHHLNFDVWAGKKVNDATQAVYAKGVVTYADETWTANPLKYWDKVASEYYFYAGAPSSSSWQFAMTEAGNYATGYLKYEYFKLNGENIANGTNTYGTTWAPANAVDDIDLMIAAPKKVERVFYNVTSPTLPGKVEMQFNHILSRLNIMVKKGENIDANHKLVLTSLTVYGLKNKGSFDENKEEADQTAKTSRWYDQSVDGTYELTAAVPATEVTDAVYTHQYLVIPQTISSSSVDVNGTTADMADNPYFRIEYTIADEVYFAYYNLASAFSANSLSFNEGWQNTLTITINPNVINFDATVSEWGTYLDRGTELE